MKVSRRTSPLLVPAAMAAAALAVACGGSDGTPATTSLSGSVVKGPVSGAQVCAYKATSSGKGEQIQCVTTTASGGYTMEFAYNGDVVIEATGGSYTDEATSTTKTLSDPMRVVLRTQGGSTVGMVTPLTTVAYSIAAAGTGGLSSTSFNTAATSVASQFQLGSANIVTTAPVVTGTTNAYGNMLRAVSQYVANGGTLATFFAYVNPASFQAAFSTAYAAINGTTITFSLGNTSGGTGGTGGSSSCGITVSGTGTVSTGGFSGPFTLPPTKICVTGVPAGACSAGNSTLQSLASAGATPQGNYSINYTYSYAPGDCSGALVTVSYQ